MRTVASVFGLFAFILLIGWVASFNNLALNSVFLPANEQVRRTTFEQSKAYRQGMVQELENMQYDYITADEAHKPALASIIRHRAADVDLDSLPPDLSHFIRSLPQ